MITLLSRENREPRIARHINCRCYVKGTSRLASEHHLDRTLSIRTKCNRHYAGAHTFTLGMAGPTWITGVPSLQCADDSLPRGIREHATQLCDLLTCGHTYSCWCTCEFAHPLADYRTPICSMVACLFRCRSGRYIMRSCGGITSKR